MINQPTGSSQSSQQTQPLATQVQIRQNLALKQLDSNTEHILNAQNQPLSPTHSQLNNQHQNQAADQKGIQSKVREIKGIPQMVGLTTIEYGFNEKSLIKTSEITQQDVQDNYQHLEMQLEGKMQSTFKKYIKLLKIEASYDSNSSLYLLAKHAFFDQNKKPSQKRLIELSEQKKDQIFSKTQNVLEQIKNEILPLFNGSDEDIDELDDEVAMISNKKSATSKNMKLNDMISHEEIKVEIVEKPKTDQQNNQEESEETRNFNTLPRNYSDPANRAVLQDSSYIDMDLSSNMYDQQLLSKDMMMSQQESSIQQNQNGKDDLSIIEQDIFSNSKTHIEQIQKILQRSIQGIKITGFNCNQIHAITNMTYFINQSFYLKQKQRLAEAQEYDYLSGILMISTKRYTQAVEVFRKIQMNHLKHIETLKDSNKLLKEKLILKCASLELLIAESMSQPNQINDKLLSLQRLTELSQQRLVKQMTFTPQLNFTDDPFTILLKIIPELIKFIVTSLKSQSEIVKISALKLLGFILETQGCSLDHSMVYLLKALVKSYPQSNDSGKDGVEFSKSIQEYFNVQVDSDSQHNNNQTTYLKIKEPTSGFQTALKSAFNATFETYMSVLSSVSSHILHELFYQVILPTITSQQVLTPEIKVFSVKMAEKVITICQGDLILVKPVLEFFITQTTLKQVAGSSKENETLISSVKGLWSSIRSKVFTNYSQKGLKTLIDWIVDKMSQIAQNAQNALQLNTEEAKKALDDNANQDISMLEINDEESQQLMQMFDIVSMISIGRKNNEAEANSLIKIKQDYCLELYMLINPLLFWLDFSVEREERFPLFKAIYSTIKDVLENLPPKRVDIDLLQIMIPILQRTTEYLKNNSPSLHMLKFLDIVLKDLKQAGYCSSNPELQYFFLDMLNNFVGYISYCLYEEVFTVFDKLLTLCSDVVNEAVLTKCIVALVDKYTIKSKAHKSSLQAFMKTLMEVKVRAREKDANQSHRTINNTDEDLDDDQISVRSKNNYFEILCEFCFFGNKDPLPMGEDERQKNRQEFKSPIDLHDLYIDKLQFFIESLAQLTEIHVNLFTSLIMHPQFKPTLMGLLTKGETSLRLKCHELLELISNFYVQHCTSKTVYRMAAPPQNPQSAAPPQDKKSSSSQDVLEVEYINQERMYLAQIVLHVAKESLTQKDDAYLQFNSLIILDYLFQNLLPVPTYQNEIQKERINKNQHVKPGHQQSVVDLITVDITEDTPEFEVTSPQYTYLRAEVVLKLWPYVQSALNSPWSNIRSICYGLICSMLKVDLKCLLADTIPLGHQYAQKFKSIVLPMLDSLLSSKESESKAGGLNILGSFCGLSYDFSKVKISKNLEFFRKNSQHISVQIWQLVFDLQDDWDITIKEASVVLIQLCAPRDAVKYFDKVKRDIEDKRFTKMLSGYGLEHNMGNESSRLGSARNHFSMLSNEDLLPNSLQQREGINMIGSPMSNPAQLSGLDIFDHIGNTINSAQALGTFELDEIQRQAIQHEQDQFDFFVDTYMDDQIQEIISIFRNDFKPPKNLWIEKNPNQGFNGPDYYAEIFSSAIEQFNQHQLHMQQQQNQLQQQQMVSSPKNKQSMQMIDALEDDLVKKYENEKIEKKDFMIFERNFEDQQKASEEVKIDGNANNQQIQDDTASNQEVAVSNETNEKAKIETGNTTKSNGTKQKKGGNGKSKDEKKKSQPSLQLQIVDENETMSYKSKDPHVSEEKKVSKKKKTTDELIEEYERKISKTKQLLEEEKKKTNKTNSHHQQQQPYRQDQQLNIYETGDRFISEAQAKSTPEFKQKQASHISKKDNDEHQRSAEKKKQPQILASTEIPKSFQGNIDNAKLIKQINNCFNDNSFNNFNIGPVVMTASLGNNGAKHKQKLNKSFENILAANKQLKSGPDNKAIIKKNLSSSPRRGSSSGKKGGSQKQGVSRKKYLDQTYQQTGKNQTKALYNMRDLNYFIKTIEKDLSDKFSKLSMKDFNSMPTTPTSILKKVEDQMKAMANQSHGFNKADIKAQMSNTCPNMTQVLSQLDQPLSYQSQPKQGHVLTQLNMNGPDYSSKHQSQGYNDPFHSSQHTPSNISHAGVNNMMMAQSQNSLSNYSIGNQMDKFTFSKTQKIDFKDSNKNLFGYPHTSGRDGHTAREHSNENTAKLTKAVNEANKVQKIKSHSKGAYSKRSRGSQDKYLTGNQAITTALMNNQSSSSSQSKLNKSLNNISTVSAYSSKQKDKLSKSMISSLAKAGNLSPTSKKLIQQMIKQQLTGGAPQSQATTQIHQTPATTQGQQMTNQYSYASNLLYDYGNNSDQTQKKSSANTKTPVKSGNKQIMKGVNYSEIIEISPSSGDKHEHRPYLRNIL